MSFEAALSAVVRAELASVHAAIAELKALITAAPKAKTTKAAAPAAPATESAPPDTPTPTRSPARIIWWRRMVLRTRSGSDCIAARHCPMSRCLSS